MKGIILCGGNGTRLRPLTNITNKHLLAVYDKPMIEYPLKTMMDMDIDEMLIISGREHAGAFVNYLGSGKDRNVEFTYRVQEQAGGIAEALGLAERFAHGEPVAVILGDNYFAEPISLPTENGFAHVVVKSVRDPERFGVYDPTTGLIEEKPADPKSSLAVTGLYLYPPDVFEVIKTLKPSGRGELEITDVNNFYGREERIGMTGYDGFWSDMGTPESLARTIEYIKNNK